MIGIQIFRPACIYGENQSVLSNTLVPESELSEKHHSIAYNVVRQGYVREEWLTGYCRGEDNTLDTLTKTITAEKWGNRLVGNYS